MFTQPVAGATPPRLVWNSTGRRVKRLTVLLDPEQRSIHQAVHLRLTQPASMAAARRLRGLARHHRRNQPSSPLPEPAAMVRTTTTQGAICNTGGKGGARAAMSFEMAEQLYAEDGAGPAVPHPSKAGQA